MTEILYALVSTALYYIIGRAGITRPIWSRYPKWLDKLVSCAACSGFWIGLGVGAAGAWAGRPYFDIPGRSPLAVLVAGLVAMVTTPVLYWLLETAVIATLLQPDDGPSSPGS